MNKILRERNIAAAALKLIEGDITLAEVDAIVNPANSQLKHGGGLAGLLSQKAGPVLQLESDIWVKEHGPVEHESPAYTAAGELPFKYIIHAVGPVWGTGDELQKLTDAVQGALSVADNLGVQSIALPAISTGIFGFPLEPAGEVILSAIRNYLEKDSETRLDNIQVVLYDDRSAAVFSEVWDQYLK